MTGDADAIEQPRTEGLRELKKQRTRRALIDAAFRLFDTDGYEKTTVAGIAAEAEVATKTFFNYFPDKEAVVFHDAQERVTRALHGLQEPRPGEAPSALLTRVIGDVLDHLLTETEESRHLTLWLDLISTVPALQARALRISFDLERLLSNGLRSAYPGRFDPVTAAAVVGAVSGAAQSALGASLREGRRPQDRRVAVRRGLELAVSGIRAADAGAPS